MRTQSLSEEISACIENFQAVLDKDPSNLELSETIMDMYTALQQAEEKEWDQQTESYKTTKEALDKAKVAAQKALDDLSKTADALNKATAAIEKTLSIIPFAA